MATKIFKMIAPMTNPFLISDGSPYNMKSKPADGSALGSVKPDKSKSLSVEPISDEPAILKGSLRLVKFAGKLVFMLLLMLAPMLASKLVLAH